MVFIYTLQLEQQKYYIGKTNNPQFRLDSHFNLNGSEWTKKYKPIQVVEIIPNCDDYDEDKYTIKYMEKYGINNVRGGSFCEIQLREENKTTLKRMITGTTDKCFICGEKGHFAKECNKDDDNFSKLLNELEELLVKNELCFRCYRKGHYADFFTSISNAFIYSCILKVIKVLVVKKTNTTKKLFNINYCLFICI